MLAKNCEWNKIEINNILTVQNFMEASLSPHYRPTRFTPYYKVLMLMLREKLYA